MQGLTMDTTEQKAEMSQWTEEKLQGANTLTRVQMKDDWYILLDLLPRPTQTTQPALPPSVLATAVDVHKETKEEEVQLIKTQVKTIIFEEERREMLETSLEVVQMNPIPFEKRDVPSGATIYTTEQNAEIRQWIEGELQRAKILPPVQMKDDWYILLDLPTRPTQTTQTALPPSGTTKTTPVLATAVDVHKESREEEVQLIKTQVKMMKSEDERRETLETSHEVIQMKPIPFEKRDVSSDVASLRPQQTVTIKEMEVTCVKKPMIIIEKQVIVGRVEKKIPATMHKDEDNWFVLFTPEQIEKKVIATAGVSDTWILEEKRLREVQKGQLSKDVKRSHVVEDKRLHPYVPGPKAEERHRDVIDDWFLLLEPVSKISVNIYKRSEEDQRRKDELFKKQALAADRRKVAGFKHPSAPIIPLTPADQPMTSTPTAQSVRITRPTYQEERLKRLEITQEITQDIKQESKVESESIIKRKRREKRIEGESIYIRHSILMLEDSDVTQEIVLNHHASVSELKRIFMEDMPVFGPTEWDRRLSTYTPVIYPKLSNGELFTGIGIMGAEGLSAM
ncbi:protein 4.1b isoform X11 [Tachysurus ichikawai]